MDKELLKIKKHIAFLFAYSIFITLLVIVLAILLFRGNSTGKLSVDELTAKRINIIEPNGKPRLVISNMERSPASLSYGKPYGIKGGNRPGIIFYNDEATECGGLIFSGRRDSNGKYFASGQLSFDQYNQNQSLYVQYLDDNADRKAGLYVDDWHTDPPFPQWRAAYKALQKLPESTQRDEKLKQMMELPGNDPAYAHRVFIGKDNNRSSLINLSDKKGQTRIQLIVDSAGQARINFFDAQGKIVSSLPHGG